MQHDLRLAHDFQFFFFAEASLFHQNGKPGNVFWKKHEIVNQLFVILVAENDRLSFVAPWA